MRRPVGGYNVYSGKHDADIDMSIFSDVRDIYDRTVLRIVVVIMVVW